MPYRRLCISNCPTFYKNLVIGWCESDICHQMQHAVMKYAWHVVVAGVMWLFRMWLFNLYALFVYTMYKNCKAYKMTETWKCINNCTNDQIFSSGSARLGRHDRTYLGGLGCNIFLIAYNSLRSDYSECLLAEGVGGNNWGPLLLMFTHWCHSKAVVFSMDCTWLLAVCDATVLVS